MKSAQCTYLHPELFSEGPDGYPVPTDARLTDEQREAADEAIELCPAQAIEILAD